MLISPVPAFVLWKVFRIQEKDIQTEREKVEIAIQKYSPPHV
jgi:hypothetical protein